MTRNTPIFQLVESPFLTPVRMEKYIRIFSLPVPVLLSICLSRLIWPFTLVEKFVCNITFTLKVNFVFSIITILVKLSELIWGVTILVLWFVSNDRSSHRTCSVRKAFLRNFTKLTGKHLCQSLFFNKAAGYRLDKMRFLS